MPGHSVVEAGLAQVRAPAHPQILVQGSSRNPIQTRPSEGQAAGPWG